MRQNNNQTDSLGGLEEGGTFDGGGKFTQDSITDADRGESHRKERVEKLSNVDKNKVDAGKRREKHALLQSIRHPVCL